MMAGLGISWWRNGLASSYPATSREGADAIIFAPSMLLVLLGYAIQSVDSGMQSLHPYAQLSEKLLPARTGLGFNPVTHSVFTIGYRPFVQTKSILLFLSSCVWFLVPAIKIVAAALFATELRPYIAPTSLSFDSSLVTNLNAYNLTNPNDLDSQENLLET
jgi:hypothetical protein